ncbi:acyl carrier protein [Pseudomonas savastanoi]|uniref:acyl carrier protein n=1 Tax=Pseudomonas savastanoi TaxID=29438 RepID=UPI001E4952CB|nr:acyl carrier protein [Pseudomonas savastanoi]UFI44958.1 acyl carrier protein [Pseudomonas savastanoi]
MSDTEAKVIAILSEKLGLSESRIKPTDRLVEDLNSDDLDSAEAVMALQDEFGFMILDKEFLELKTVQDIVDYVSKNKK